jgi:hypothetical protein
MPGRHAVVRGFLGEKTSKNTRCQMNSRMVYSHCNSLEATGLNKIFGHREDDPVHHESELSRKLAKNVRSKEAQNTKTQSPDAIYGLRLTRNIENLLHDTTNTEIHKALDADPKHVHELLNPSPFDRPLKQMGDHLVFPFLILEAKSGSATDDWHSI